MTPNPDNYCSLELSQRLVDAGIVLETEKVWVHYYVPSKKEWRWVIYYKKDITGTFKTIPAPNLSELWRELPGRIDNLRLTAMRMSKGTTIVGYINPADMCWVCKFDEYNPCDALAELCIWVEGEI
jgi:hypothetical protein